MNSFQSSSLVLLVVALVTLATAYPAQSPVENRGAPEEAVSVVESTLPEEVELADDAELVRQKRHLGFGGVGIGVGVGVVGGGFGGFGGGYPGFGYGGYPGYGYGGFGPGFGYGGYRRYGYRYGGFGYGGGYGGGYGYPHFF